MSRAHPDDRGDLARGEPSTRDWREADAQVHMLPVTNVPPGDQRRATLVRLSDVQAEEVTWLWPGRLPVGKLIVLDGDPSLGKSTLALTLAAHLSVGRDWPDGTPCPTADTVILSAEDGLADTVRPRVDAAGGDPHRVHALTEVGSLNEDGERVTRPPRLRDVDAIEEALTSTGARLLVVDVMMAFLGGGNGSDSHRDQDMRSVLAPIAAVADRTGAAVLLLRHLTKGRAGGSPMNAGGGSIGIVGACRAGFIVAPDPDDETGTRRILAATKNNLAPMPPSMTFWLESVPGTHVARVAWGEASPHDAADLLRPAEEQEERGERDEAVEWLQQFLTDAGGAAPAKDVVKAAKAEGIAERTLKRARRRAGVESERAGFPARSTWSFDPVGPQSGLSGQLPDAGTTGPTGGPTAADLAPAHDDEEHPR